jgi:hypothetical protein
MEDYNYYTERDRKNREMHPYTQASLYLVVLIVLVGSMLNYCAPAVISEQEYQERKIAEALKAEAKYRGSR